MPLKSQNSSRSVGRSASRGSVGYQVWNDYRFIASFFDLSEAEACMNRMVPSTNICA
ncbi:hypothetical protein SAMN05444161_6953 [Rhizobiales bacterium GAS191]|jgi:hypothetical protein|nr:hypothetical protein SAMN05519103_06269 [Rhizobiales bacterium GAS113]SEE74299.1 hypothetical protein SAMN05444161_6953 [Rhizobiales bacterium GAS191]